MDSIPASSLLTSAMSRLRQRGAHLGGAALASSVLLQLPITTACVDAPMVGDTSQNDWAQFEGHRDTTMVSYTGSAWSVCRFPNTRFGCGAFEIYIKLRVRPVSGANLDDKRVGVVYKTPEDPTERTAIGRYFTTWGNGDEEWHVPVQVSTAQKTLMFDAWYQDGAGHTYLDDNEGELHVFNDGPAYQVVRVEPWRTTVTVDDSGVRGSLSVQVADLDFDKDIELLATTDGWATVTELGQGAAGDTNRWYWAEDYAWSGRERWQIDLDLPDGGGALEFAVVYRHGVVNNARTYEFWDNNGGANHVVARTPAE